MAKARKTNGDLNFETKLWQATDKMGNKIGHFYLCNADLCHTIKSFTAHRNAGIIINSKKISVEIFQPKTAGNLQEKKNSENNGNLRLSEVIESKRVGIFGAHSSVVEQVTHNHLVRGSNPCGPS